MPVIPIIRTDSQRMVEYKIYLQRRSTEQEAALKELATYRAYYQGNHDLLLTDEQKSFLDEAISYGWPPIDNKCKVVIQQLRAMVDVDGLSSGGQVAMLNEDGAAASPALAALVAWWHENNMDRWERELYKAALRDGEAYVLCWHDGQQPRYTVGSMWDGDTGIRMFYEDDETRTTPMYASKHWWDTDPVTLGQGVKRITVYTPSAIYKYAQFLRGDQRSRFIVAGPDEEDGLTPIMDQGDMAWPLPWVDAQGRPLGLAVVPFVMPDGSVLTDVIGLNNALNKTNIDLLSMADQQGFGVYVVEYEILPAGSTDPTEDDDGLGLRPGRVLETTGTAKKLPADDMKPMLAAAEHWITTIAGNTGIPMHSFVPIAGQVPSGTALEILEGNQAERADEIISSFTSSWKAVWELAQKLDLLYGATTTPPVDVSPVWKETTRRNPEREMKELQVEQMRLALQRERELGTREGMAEE